jgi:uncharacterized OB-fold protein
MSARQTTPQEFADLSVGPPTPTGESQPFWDAAAEGVLRIQRCARCGAAQGHPRRRCSACWADALEWVDAGGGATVVTHSLVHRPGQAAWASVAPYYVALVRLDEGAVMLTQLLAGDRTPRVGDRCAVEFVRVGEWSLPFFRLAAEII